MSMPSAEVDNRGVDETQQENQVESREEPLSSSEKGDFVAPLLPAKESKEGGAKPTKLKKKIDAAQSAEGPEAKKAKVLRFEDTYLRSIPSASQYEKSFMHRDTITHVIATETDFIITASIDGHLKFWKKKYAEGVEFVKHFRCHLSKFADVAVNFNGTLLATVCEQDKSVKIFDIENFDMINMMRFDFVPRRACWIHQGADVVPYLAVTKADNGEIVVLDGKGTKEPLFILDKIHAKPVRLISYEWLNDVVISIDESGMVEMWGGAKREFAFPDHCVEWKYKTDTDLYEFIKLKTVPVCLAVSPNGSQFATLSEDRRVRIFDIRTGKIVATLDETLPRLMSLAKEQRNFGLQNMEWNRRLAQEKEMDKNKAECFQSVRLCWDHSGHFLLYPSPTGVKVYNVVTGQIVREIGREETIRITGISLCRAVPDIRARLQGAAVTIETEAADNPNLNKSTDPDPVMVCCALRKNRFYLFTNSEPFSTEEGDEHTVSRDIFNEKPKKEDQLTAVEQERELNKLTEGAVLHTSMGDVHLKLFGGECPRTVENWCTLARRGYYNGLTFHRVIKSFMIQTGDPTGKGTGGQSIWGSDFEDEFHPRLKHDKPFMVSMANAGPNSNGSQFFITVCPAEWLDGKNTLFGEVVEGMNVVRKINQVQTYEKSGRPKTEIKILSISLK